MNWDSFLDNLPLIATVVGILILQFIIRRRRSPGTSEVQIVQGLLSDIRVNLRLVEVLNDGEQIKAFRNTSWKIYGQKIEFLDQSLQSALIDAFEIAEDYNSQVASAKKYKSVNYIASINAGKLEDRLKRCKDELEAWLMKKTGTTDPAGKSGFLDDLIGKV